MKKIIKSFIKLTLSLSVFTLVLNPIAACANYETGDDMNVVVDNGYTFYSTYEEEKKNIKIEIYDGDEYIQTLNFPYYSSLEEYLATKDNLDVFSNVIETETGFGYYPQNDYWEYACSQELVDSGVVDFRGIAVALDKIVTVQEQFRKKVDEAISLEGELESEYGSMWTDLLLAILQAFGAFVEPTFFVGAVISYFESLGHVYNHDGIEADYTELNKDLADLFIRLDANKMPR